MGCVLSAPQSITSAMRISRSRSVLRTLDDGVEISSAAIAGYARLRRLVGGRIETHPTRDGGLICEKRINRTRSILWHVTADGALVCDSIYSFRSGTFVRRHLPGSSERH